MGPRGEEGYRDRVVNVGLLAGPASGRKGVQVLPYLQRAGALLVGCCSNL